MYDKYLLKKYRELRTFCSKCNTQVGEECMKNDWKCPSCNCTEIKFEIWE